MTTAQDLLSKNYARIDLNDTIGKLLGTLKTSKQSTALVFDDGTYAHSLTTPAGQTAPPPKELGFYSVQDGRIRLWQARPELDRTVPFEFLGDLGRNGAVMDGIRMRAVR